MTMILDGSLGVTFNDASLQPAAASPYVLKNKIINGAMVIDQRNAGASVNNGTGTVYTLDRWASYGGTSNKFSIQQDAGGVTPPVGFNDYLGITSSSAYAVPAGESYQISQLIEGYNIADLAWGTANAKTVTLSFWVRSSLTGTFGGALQNGSFNYSYPFSYTILSANTWEFKTITIAGPTAGTWNVTTAIGIVVNFGLGIGSTYSGTAGAWAAVNYGSATGAVSVVGTNGATFYITGVQLEQNTSATPFERRLYNQELANCQRYYEKSYNTDVAIATVTSVSLKYSSGMVGSTTTSFLSDGLTYRVTKRGTPTITFYDGAGNSGKCNRESFGVTTTNNSTVAVSYEGLNNAVVFSSGSAAGNSISYHYTISAEL
jgi:hypothetical protein